MGGSIRKDMSSKVTHLIAAAATGDKYRYASGFGLPVLARSWVDACWERRDDPTCFATNDDIIVSMKHCCISSVVDKNETNRNHIFYKHSK